MRKVVVQPHRGPPASNPRQQARQGMTPYALNGVEPVFYPMRDEQVARLGQLDRPAHQFCGDPRAARLRHASRRDRCLHCVGREFSGIAATELTAAVKR